MALPAFDQPVTSPAGKPAASRHRGRWMAALSSLLAAAGLAMGREKPSRTIVDEWESGNAVFKSWTTLDGMPSNQVTALAQTKDGYLWVGTSGGVARFDGARFVVYGEKEGISRIPVEKLVALPDGGLWVFNAAETGYWLEGGRFVRDGRSFVEVVLGEDGRVYGYDGKTISSLDGGIVVDAPEEIDPAFAELAVTEKGTFWLLQLDQHDTRIWIRENETWRRWRGFDEGFPEPLVDSVRVTATGGEGVWLGSHSGVLFLTGQNPPERIAAPWEPDHGLRCLVRGGDGGVWLGPYSGGLYRWRDGSFATGSLLEKQGNPAINDLLEGRGGEIWIGTEDRGLVRVGDARVRTHRPEKGPALQVTALLPLESGEILVGTKGNGTFLRGAEGLNRYVTEPGFDEDYGFVSSFLRSQTGSIWIGAAWGLNELRDGKRLTDEAFAEQFGHAGDTVWCLAETEDGSIWTGRNGGRLNRVKGREVETVASPVTSSIFSMEKDAEGNLWMATMGQGVVIMDRDRTFRVLTGERGLPTANLTELHCDASGTMWVGSDGEGLFRWQSGEGRFQPLRFMEEEQPGNVLQIQSDDHGWLWIGTTRGICGFDAGVMGEGSSGPVTPLWLGSADGMASEQCTRMKAAKDKQGRLYFGTTDGFVDFDPEEVKKSSVTPRPLIEEFRVEGVPPVSLSSRNREAPWEVPPGARFEIRFTGLSPESAERMRFRYRITDLEPEWVEVGSRRFVDFSSAPPGRYRFELQAGDTSRWNPRAEVLDLRIRPFYWQTWWFRAFLASGVLAAGYGLTKIRERRRMERLLAELDRKRAVNQERERMARDLHDSLGAGITHAGLLAEDLGGPENPAARLKERLQALSRELDTAIWMTNPADDRLARICDYLSSYAHEWFRQAGIRCRLDVAAPLPEMEIAPEARHHLFQAVKESLNNVLKHANASEVRLDIGIRDGDLRISIRDNGRGFDPESAASANRHGLDNLRKRMRQAGGSANIRTSPAGTTVELALRLSAVTSRDTSTRPG